jgi:hypothetical protein
MKCRQNECSAFQDIKTGAAEGGSVKAARLRVIPLWARIPSEPNATVEDFHLQAVVHARHNKKKARKKSRAFVISVEGGLNSPYRPCHRQA